MSADIKRLPVQHPHRPHCEHCGADLPSFNGLCLTGYDMEPAMANITIQAITIHVQCKCGALWNLRKDSK